jgi:hypothetical protein
MQVEKWWGIDSRYWDIIEFADRQEYMFLQNKISEIGLGTSEDTEKGEEWKGPYG